MQIKLSPKQQEAVEYKGKHLMVIAGAGSGKTRVLTERIKKLIENLKNGEKVLAITFSNKASEELQERIKDALGEKEVAEKSYIGTTHKFCLDIVSSRGSLIGLPENINICESYNDRIQILKESIESVPAFKENYLHNDPKQNQKTINELLEEISFLKRNLETFDSIEDIYKRSVFEEYDNILLQQGLIDFDDILRYAYRILNERESVAKIYRRVYKYICVDEAQDLNKAQFEVIRTLAGTDMGITMVGDPKQSIYGFNGSKSDYFEKDFVTQFKAFKIELNENYRSSQKVIENANIIENSFKAIGVLPIKGEFEIHSMGSDESEARYIYEKILYFLQNGNNDVENERIELEQIAVIGRNKYVFQKLEQLFKQNGIEYTLKTSVKGAFPSESDMMKAFGLGMRLISNPRDRIHLNEFRKLLKLEGEQSFDEIRNSCNLSPYWLLLLECLNPAWDLMEQTQTDIRFNKVVKSFSENLDNKLKDIDENDRFLISQDLNLWEMIWNGYIRKSSPGDRTLGNFIRTLCLGGTYTPKDKGVVLTTVHMSKGLEYDVVFIMGLCEGVFPDYRAVNDSLYNNNDKQLKEERHNMFVAITRSKRLCYLTYPRTKNTPWGIKTQMPSRYIKELCEYGDNQIILH